MLKKLLGHSFLYAVGPQVPRLAGIVALPLTTQYLTPVDYGIAGIVAAYAGALSGARDLGLSVVLANTYFAHPKRWPIIWRRLHGFLSLWSIPFAAIVAALLWLVLPSDAQEHRGLVIALNCLPLVLFETTSSLGARYLQFAERPMYMSVITAITGTVTVGLNVLFIAGLRMGYLGWFLSSAIGSALTFALYLKPTYGEARLFPTARFSRKFLRQHLAVSLPVVPHNYSTYLLNGAERFVMDRAAVPVAQIGQYNAATLLGNYVNMGMTAVGMAVGPMMTRLYARRTPDAARECRDLVFVLQGLALAGSAVIALWAKEIMYLLIRNEALRVAYPIASIAIMSHASRPMYWAVVGRLAFEGRTGQLWKISFGAGIVNVALCFLVIPVFGAFAAIGATFVSQLLLGFAGFALPEFREVEPERYRPVALLMVTAAVAVAVLLLQDIGSTAKLAASVATCIATAAAFRAAGGRLRSITH